MFERLGATPGRRWAIVAAGLTVIVVAVALGVVAARGPRDDTAGRAATSTGSRPTTTVTSTTEPSTSTTTTTTAPPTTITTTTVAPTTAAPTTTQPPPTTPPVTDAPPDDGVEPASPPVTLPLGAQGPVQGSACRPTGPPQIVPPVQEDTQGWVTVAQLDGNCGGTSGVFTTSGAEARLVYRSDAEQFFVFVVSQADPESSGGFADVECRRTCAAVQGVETPPGAYRLAVQATNGPWHVELQELR